MSSQPQVVSSRTSVSRNNANRCTHSTSDNRRCRMLLHSSHPSLCPFHARQQRLILESERVGPELATVSGEFRTHADVNHALGKLWNMLAHDRIPRKRAATMAYIAALLLPTLEPVRIESNRINGGDAWLAVLRRAFPLPKSLEASNAKR